MKKILITGLTLMTLSTPSYAAKKAAIILKNIPNGSLTQGQKVNTAAVLGATIGAAFPEILGQDLKDASGTTHSGISTLPITILKQPQNETMNDMIHRFQESGLVDVRALNKDTSTTNNYDDYAKKLITIETKDVEFFGVVIYGEKEAIEGLTPKSTFKLL
jgi:hypothetical protein